MRNELGHSAMRATLKKMRRGPRLPKVGNVIARHYCKKIRHALARWRLQKGVVLKTPPKRMGTTLVSASARLLRQAVKRKRLRRSSVQTTVGHGVLSAFLNEKRKAHKQRHGKVNLVKFRELEAKWKAEFAAMGAEDRSNLEERYSSQVSLARELHSLKAGGRKRRRKASWPAGPTDSEQAARPELCPSLLGIGDEYAVRPETIREHVFEACGSSKSYLSCVDAVQAEALPKPSLGSLMAAADDGLDPGKVGKFRVRCMSCKDKHYVRLFRDQGWRLLRRGPQRRLESCRHSREDLQGPGPRRQAAAPLQCDVQG